MSVNDIATRALVLILSISGYNVSREIVVVMQGGYKGVFVY